MQRCERDVASEAGFAALGAIRNGELGESFAPSCLCHYDLLKRVRALSPRAFIDGKVLMITIVSGLPRSGTSLMMQMLAAGGMPVLSDGERKADTDNPKGYLEWERVKQLPKDPSLIAEAEGKVVKVISQLMLSLPDGHEYRIVFMQRPLAEVMKSQDEMLKRRGTYEPGGNS